MQFGKIGDSQCCGGCADGSAFGCAGWCDAGDYGGGRGGVVVCGFGVTGPGGGYVWRAFPPEVPSTLLRKGPGVGPLLAAAEARRSLGNQYALAAEELGAVLTGVQSEAWQGPSAERYVDAHLPHQAWLEQTAADFAEAADQHEVAATAYVTALATMPTVGELAANHVAHTALVSTNFFGINTIPIAANEADYERMWDQAATTMQVYQTVTTAALLTVPPITSAPPIVHPGVGAANDIGANGAVVGDVIWELLLGALCLIRDVFRPIVYAIEVFVEEMYEDWGFEVVWFLEGLVGWIGELVQTPGGSACRRYCGCDRGGWRRRRGCRGCRGCPGYCGVEWGVAATGS